MEGNFFIPAELLTRNNGNLEEISREIAHLLASNLPDDAKNKLFQNSLNRYQLEKDQLNKPLEAKFTMPPPPPPPPTPPPFVLDSPYVTPHSSRSPNFDTPQTSDKTFLASPDTNHYVPNLDIIPKTKKAAAKLLVEHVRSIPNFGVDGTGRISYKGELVEDSNLTDLVADFTRNTQQTPPPGTRVFARALKESNVPLSSVGNKNRKDLVRNPAAKLFKQAVQDISPQWKEY